MSRRRGEGLIYNAIAGHGIERMAALSDGVFAVAMTLIVLEIRIPAGVEIHSEAQLLHALGQLGPRFVTYLLGFMTLGIFWVGQQAQLNLLSSSDRNLTWIHFVFLAMVALVPFSTTLLAEYLYFHTALAVYWLNLCLLGVLLLVSWRYARRAELIEPDVAQQTTTAIERRIVVYQLLYAVGLVLGFFHPLLGIGFILLLQLNSAVAPRLFGLDRL